MIISQSRLRMSDSSPIKETDPNSTYVCLICFEPTPRELTRVCETCTEAVVCQDCLEQYRKHWNQQCCICKKGEGVKISVLETGEDEEARQVSRTDKNLFYVVSMFSFLVPIPLLWLWLECNIFANPIDKEDAIFRAVVYWIAILPLIDIALVYRRYQFFWAFLIKMWLLVGNCVYVLASFLFRTYGTFIYYYATIALGPLLVLIPLASLTIITRAMLFWTFRGSSSIRPI